MMDDYKACAFQQQNYYSLRELRSWVVLSEDYLPGLRPPGIPLNEWVNWLNSDNPEKIEEKDTIKTNAVVEVVKEIIIGIANGQEFDDICILELGLITNKMNVKMRSMPL